MLRKKSVCRGILYMLFMSIASWLPAQNSTSYPPLEFKHQQRIVFLGNSFFENELSYGYLEYALSSRWPDADLTFRNLGWTGDNVYAEARSTFTTPPTAYQQMFMQIRAAKPNYVFIAYGGIESQQGAEGIDHFTRGLEIIIDSVEALGAESILISTIPVERAGTPENTELQNRNLKLYSETIAKIAAKRKKRFIDVYEPLAGNREGKYDENGIHLNNRGYYYLANVIEKALGWPERGEKISIDSRQKNATGNARLVDSKDGRIAFTVKENLLPLPATPEGYQEPGSSVSVQVTGLKKGFYTLSENGRQLVTASAADWANGVLLDHGQSIQQADKIRDYMVKKNDLFFQQYRPLNRTYILGFRAYEQGRHKKGLEDLNFIITYLEAQINLHRKPVIKTYELSPVR